MILTISRSFKRFNVELVTTYTMDRTELSCSPIPTATPAARN